MPNKDKLHKITKLNDCREALVQEASLLLDNGDFEEAFALMQVSAILSQKVDCLLDV